MSPQPPSETSPGVIPHLGELLCRIRRARGLSRATLARACGVHRSTILHFEQHGQLFRTAATYERYLGALAEATLASSDLRLDEAHLHLLRDLFERAQRMRQREDESHLAAISFVDTRDSNVPDLRVLIDQLQRQPYPAALIDCLGFIHAINGSFARMFGLQPDMPHYQHWSAWHLLAAELPRQSPLRQALNPEEDAGLLFTAALHQLFATLQAYRWLFTRQMQALQARIDALAYAEDHQHYQSAWRLVSSLQVPRRSQQALRIVRLGDECLVLALTPGPTSGIRLSPKITVWYRILVWQPLGCTVERLLTTFRDQRIVFAADCDRHATFHVNTWPEITGAS